MSNCLRKIYPDIIAVVFFLIISFLYFTPQVFEGKVLFQNDAAAAVGTTNELVEFTKAHPGKITRWMNNMFSGMPTFQMAPSYNSQEPISFLTRLYSLFLPSPVSLLFVMFLGFYILLRVLKIKPLTSVLGSVMWTFSSYFFIIIGAGHLWKFITLSYIPPTIAGIILIYNRKYIVGSLLVMIFSAFQILGNHIQMSYYFGFLIICLIVAFFIISLREKRIKTFIIASLLVLFSGGIGLLTNITTIYETYEYSKETMRGPSELKSSPEQHASKGLSPDYITQWSYGVGETLSLLIPNVKGGASIPLVENPKAMEKADYRYSQFYQNFGQYWGDQPGTSGPVYVGVLAIFLFFVGVMILKGPLKWALIAATILSIVLSWGKNFMPFTNFFIEHVPLYNKFRAVSSILVVAEFTIPLLAILAIAKLLKDPSLLFGRGGKNFFIPLVITAGIPLFFALFPSTLAGPFLSATEKSMLAKLPTEQIQPMIQNLQEMRSIILTSDAWRSFFFAVICATILFLFAKRKIKAIWLVPLLIIVSLIDQWGVDKRYLSESNFSTPQDLSSIFKEDQADKVMLSDSTRYFRVLDLSRSPFNDYITPYRFKSVGGYHAAKLRRYQDVIDNCLVPEIGKLQSSIVRFAGNMDSVPEKDIKVLNMLDTRWLVMPTSEGRVPLLNPHTQGNAWFVDSIIVAKGAREEMDLLKSVDLRRCAIVDQKFSEKLAKFPVTQASPESRITMLQYDSNKLHYRVNAAKDELAVFSEVYYPYGWHVHIDGKSVDLLRANYVLRALPIPKGEHEVDFFFYPDSITKMDKIAYAAEIIVLLFAIAVIVRCCIALRNKKHSLDK